MWNGKMVAVKVLEYSQQQHEDGCLLEGLLSEQVQHPHVVSDGAVWAVRHSTPQQLMKAAHRMVKHKSRWGLAATDCVCLPIVISMHERGRMPAVCVHCSPSNHQLTLLHICRCARTSTSRGRCPWLAWMRRTRARMMGRCSVPMACPAAGAGSRCWRRGAWVVLAGLLGQAMHMAQQQPVLYAAAVRCWLWAVVWAAHQQPCQLWRLAADGACLSSCSLYHAQYYKLAAEQPRCWCECVHVCRGCLQAGAGVLQPRLRG